MGATRGRGVGYFLILLNCLGISGKSVFIPLLYQEGLTSGEIVAGRLLFAIPALWLFFLVLVPRREWRLPDGKEWGVIMVLSVITAIPIVTHTIAYSMMSPAVTSVLVYVFPLFVVMFEWAIFKQRPERSVWVVVPLVYLGLVLLVGAGEVDMVVSNWEGVAYTVGAALAFAMYLVLQSRVYAPQGPLRLGPVGYCAWSSFVILAVTMPFVAGDIQSLEFLGRQRVICLFAAFSVFSTAIPFVALLMAVQILGATTSAIVSTITPGLTVVATALVLDDRLSSLQYSGVVLVMLGLIILRIPMKQDDVMAPAEVLDNAPGQGVLNRGA